MKLGEIQVAIKFAEDRSHADMSSSCLPMSQPYAILHFASDNGYIYICMFLQYFLHINLFTKKDIDLFFAHTDSSSCGVSEQVWHSGFKALKEVGVRKAPEVEIIRVDIVPLPRRLGRQLATQRCGRTRLLLQDCGCTSLCFIFPRDIIIIIIIIIKCKIPRKALLNVDLFLIFLCWLALSIGFDWSWL